MFYLYKNKDTFTVQFAEMNTDEKHTKYSIVSVENESKTHYAFYKLEYRKKYLLFNSGITKSELTEIEDLLETERNIILAEARKVCVIIDFLKRLSQNGNLSNYVYQIINDSEKGNTIITYTDRDEQNDVFYITIYRYRTFSGLSFVVYEVLSEETEPEILGYYQMSDELSFYNQYVDDHMEDICCRLQYHMDVREKEKEQDMQKKLFENEMLTKFFTDAVDKDI